jgi:hypothetical protein
MKRLDAPEATSLLQHSIESYLKVSQSIYNVNTSKTGASGYACSPRPYQGLIKEQVANIVTMEKSGAT